MFGIPVELTIAFFVAVVAACGYIVYLLTNGKAKSAEEFYGKVKAVAIEVVSYVEQLAKTKDMSNDEKKKLAVQKVNEILKELYGWTAPEAIVDLAIEVAVKLYNLAKSAVDKK